MNTDEKARDYLGKGKVRAQHVGEETAFFHVTGSDPEADPYFVKFSKGRWSCDCPARVPECAHIKACVLVTDYEGKRFDAPEFARDPDIDAILGDL